MELELPDTATPAERIEVQDYYTLRFTKARNFRLSDQPDRRGRREWPRGRAIDTWARLEYAAQVWGTR